MVFYLTWLLKGELVTNVVGAGNWCINHRKTKSGNILNKQTNKKKDTFDDGYCLITCIGGLWPESLQYKIIKNISAALRVPLYQNQNAYTCSSVTKRALWRRGLPWFFCRTLAWHERLTARQTSAPSSKIIRSLLRRFEDIKWDIPQ